MGLQVNIDEGQLQEQTQAAAQKALNEAFAGFEVKDALRKRAMESIMQSAITDAVDQAVDQVDLQRLASAIATELAKNMATMASYVLRESAIDCIAKMRQGSGFLTSDQEQELKKQVAVEFDAARKSGK